MWHESAVDWQNATDAWNRGPDRYEPDDDPYAADAYAPAPYPAGPYQADQYEDRYPPDVYWTQPYPADSYAAAPVGAPVGAAFAADEGTAVGYLDDPDAGYDLARRGPAGYAYGPSRDDAGQGRPYRESRRTDEPSDDEDEDEDGQPGDYDDQYEDDGQPGGEYDEDDNDYDDDQYDEDGQRRGEYDDNDYGHGEYDDGPGGNGLADPRPTRPDLRAIPVSSGSLGPGPWPVQTVASAPPPAAPTIPDSLVAVRVRPDAEPEPASSTAGQPAAHLPAPPPAASPAPPLGLAASRLPFTVSPLSAPVAAVIAAGAEPDALFRAWQGSVRAASGRSEPLSGRRPGGSTVRRGRGWQAAKIGVPAAVIVTVGAGALLMLTGRANEMLAERSATGPATSAAPGFAASPSPVRATLSGYPGEHGNVAVAAMWSASGLTVAVGNADGHPAVWRRAPDGDWSLVSASFLGGLPGHLTSVADGPLGWIAAGSVSRDGTVEPTVYQSADGMTWSPLPALTTLGGNGAQFAGVAAGPGGYLVVGRQGSGNNTTAALWWSGDLKSWSTTGGSTSNGSFTAAAVSVGNGFVAVGSEMNCHTIWTSPDGKQWTAHDLAKPDGAQSAALRSVAAGADGHIVAAGFATKNGSDLPIVVASADDGAHQTQIVLATPAGTGTGTGTGTVTAVTASPGGFVAVGLAGTAAAQHAVSWTSKDGLIWSAASPLSGAGSSEVTALTDTTPSPAAPSSTSTNSAGSGSSGTGSSGTGSSDSAASGSPEAASSVTGTAQNGGFPTVLTVPAP